jgi:hypothetical protein
MAAVTPGTVAGEDRRVVEVQQAVAVPLDLDYPGRIASHSMVVVVVQMVPAGAGAVVVLRFPMLLSNILKVLAPPAGAR